MTEIITNANDVELVITHAAGRTSTSMARIVVDDFSIERSATIESMSGVGSHLPQGISIGDVTFSFSFTINGVDASIMDGIAENDGMPTVCSSVQANDTNTGFSTKLMTCVIETDTFSATSGESAEIEVEGLATRMER